MTQLPPLAFLMLDTLDPTYNLAMEEYLFNLVGGSVPAMPALGTGLFILWHNGPSIIVGRHQNTVEEINETFVRQHNLPVVRRLTGGGAVYHDPGNLNFSFLVPVARGQERQFGFAELSAPIVQALQSLGIAAEFSQRNDITVDGKKVSGCARRQTATAVLQHGTLLVDVDRAKLGEALTGDPQKYLSKGIASHKSRVANLREFFTPGTSREECMQAIINALRPIAPPFLLTEEHHAAAMALRASRYATWDWNYGASPPFSERRRHRFSWGMVELCLQVVQGRIEQCRIFGDFFSDAEMTDLEKILTGSLRTQEDLSQRLTNVTLSHYFPSAEEAEIRKFFLE